MSQRENEHDRDAQKREFVRKLLDSYFHFRDSLPRQGYIQENKTTQQIQDELLPMCGIDTDDIVRYMTENDYSTMTEEDGTVSWAIWRLI